MARHERTNDQSETIHSENRNASAAALEQAEHAAVVQERNETASGSIQGQKVGWRWWFPVFVIAAFAVAFLVLYLAFGHTTEPAGESSPQAGATLGAYPISDMSGYACLEGYEGETAFVDMTVADIAKEMEAGSSFAFYAGFKTCPWCNVAIPILNEEALSRNQLVGYLDTRADPTWTNNTDVTDYDVLMDLVGSAFGQDDDGNPHLYVPQVFFVKGGELVYDHSGTVPDQDSPDDALSDSQVDDLRACYVQGFSAI